MNDELETENDETTNEQTAVANTDEASKETASADGGAAQQEEDLEELLKEFDLRREDKFQEQAHQASGPTDDEQQLDIAAIAQLEARLNATEQRELRRELENVFNEFTVGVEADAVDAEAFLNAQAMRDPRLNQVWEQRNSNPKAWNRVKGHLKQEFTKRFGKKVDKTATEGRNAVGAAVRSASTAAEQKELSSKDIIGLPKDEFDALQRKLGVSPV